MSAYDRTFDWVDFPEGRARFSGGTRGVDERGHETFAVEVNGIEYFGEINQSFLSDRHNFNVEIISFGHSEIFTGSTSDSWSPFTKNELKTVQSLIVQLIRAGLELEDRPSALDEFPDSRFMGEVIFRHGWILSTDENSSSISKERAA